MRAAFGFDTVACSSTGNLANSVAAQAAREGFKAWIFIPSDLEPAKILGTQVFGAELVRINGSYDHVNRLCSQIADEHPVGIRERQSAPVLRRRLEDGGLRDRRATGLALARQRRRADGWRIADHEDQEGV